MEEQSEFHARLFRIWQRMTERCNNPADYNYRHYGGRGITVARGWENYRTFARWALKNGYAHNFTLDRIDNSAGYSPSNCRWATKAEQVRNRRSTVWAEGWGERKPLAAWAEDPRCVVSYETLRQRIRKAGWALERALIQPVHAPGSTRSRAPQQRRGALLVEAWGETKTLREWIEDGRCVVGYSTAFTRIKKYGWSPERALSWDVLGPGRVPDWKKALTP